MTTQANIPNKWFVPFANGDVNRVEIPVTTSDPTRASQTLGFPPLTMQPPESGGVPPQGEDFNGGMNQVARVAWWVLNGGGWPYDSTFATNANINGYPNGATLQAADFRGDWISTADGNTNNPDTNGTNWVPGFQYGVTVVSALTGGTVTLTPAQAAKNSFTLAGTLTSALTIILPTWLKNWTITNNTTGAFVTIVKTAAGSGITIPQNGAPTRVSGDGTNIVQVAENVPVATSPTQIPQMSQVAGVVGSARSLNARIAAAGTSVTFNADEVIVETVAGGVRFCLAAFVKTLNLATTGIGGMDTGTAPVNGYVAVYAAYNPTTNTQGIFATNATSALAPNIYGGANLPAGFVATGLISVLATNGSSQLKIFSQRDRTISIVASLGLSTSTIQASLTSFSISTVVPPNALRVGGYMQNANTAVSVMTLNLAEDASGVGQIGANASVAAGAGVSIGYTIDLITQQVLYYQSASSAGTPTFSINISSYGI